MSHFSNSTESQGTTFDALNQHSHQHFKSIHMKKLSLPDNYQTVMPYLIVNNAPGLKEFMEAVFEGTVLQIVPKPGEEGIMHGEIMIGDSTIMFAEASAQWPPVTAGLYINVADADATYAKALAKGATTIMEPVDQSYGRTSGVNDPFGNVWWITTPK